MAEFESDDLVWRKGSASTTDKSGCIEAALARGLMLVRDSKGQPGLLLAFSLSDWQTFVESAASGSYEKEALDRQ